MTDGRQTWLEDGARRPWRYAAAVAVVAASTLVAEGLYRLLQMDRLSMIFLAGVLVAAVTLGSGPAYLAAILAFGVYNFYLSDPRFAFQIDSEDVIVLTMFLAVAMLTGGLAGRVRDEAQRAKARARTTAALFDASREFSSAGEEDAIREGLAKHIAEAAKGEALVWDGRRVWGARGADRLPDDLMVYEAIPAEGAAAREPRTLTAGPWRVRPLVAHRESLGLAAWRPGEVESPPQADEPLIDVLVDLGATAIARARLVGAQAEVEALARTERLRNALLSSISHDLRTPLASILASATSLREFGDRFEPSVRNDLLLTIQEEAERLNAFVANLLNMTKLESGALSIEGVVFPLAEALGRIVHRYQARRGDRTLTRHLEDERLTAFGDPILLEQALGNVVENALRFTPDGSHVEIRAARIEGRTIIEVSDEGPGVPDEDLCRIFEKFYRSPGSATTLQGTGLGLSIAKGLTEAMRGSIDARRRDDGRPGMVVRLTLPGEE